MTLLTIALTLRIIYWFCNTDPYELKKGKEKIKVRKPIVKKVKPFFRVREDQLN
jgi:hypothetical protein